MMSVWDLVTIVMMGGGGVALFPYVGPAVKRHYAKVRAEEEALEAQRQAAIQAAPRDAARTHELSELVHRQTLAEQTKRTLKAEAEVEMMQEALNHAKANGVFIEQGLKQLALPSRPVSQPQNEMEVEETPPTGFQRMQSVNSGRRAR